MASKCLMLFIVVCSGTLAVSDAYRKYRAAAQVLELVNNEANYNKDIIPFQNKSGPLEVYSTVYIRSFDVDDVKMKTIVDLTFRLKWNDFRLNYNVPGIPHVRFSDVSKFWIPDIFFRNSLKTEQMATVHPESFIEVNNKGDVMYSSRFILNLRCEMNFTRFPHDAQECPINIASYGYSTKDILLFFKKQEPLRISEHSYWSNRFVLRNSSTGECTSKTSTGEYSCLQVILSFDRKLTSYLIEWYIPNVFLVIIAFCSEFVEASALLPRLLLTLGPLLMLATASLNYSQGLVSVPYSTALDQFTGMSLTAIFAIVLHVLISHYYSLKEEGEVKPEVDRGMKDWKKLYSKVIERRDKVTKYIIIGLYFTYVFLYFVIYSF